MKSLIRTAGLALALAVRAEEATPPVPPPLSVPKLDGAITLDGDLTDPGWQHAAVIDTFFETVFGDNRKPSVATVAFVTLDNKYLYIGVRCDDPEPARIRAPFADRDNVIGTDDNVAIFLDTRGDRRSAQEFRVNPRGIQADFSFNDASSNEDPSPDYYYDTAARITPTGWSAELRIPLSTLRYAKGQDQHWGIIVWRNYPRDRRYAIYSSPLPRASNCLICFARELTGIGDLPSSSHLVVAPYVSVQDQASAPEPGAPLAEPQTDANVGLDVKWNPSASTAVDATINPDFSQVEADVAQIAVNNRFALFYPEKRPFFLEGVDLFDTPVQAVYTRTVTSPRWGFRGTGKIGSSSYTVLLTQDRGGGSVVLPGPTGSEFAPQDFESLVGIARWRREFGASFVGLLYTGREIDGGGFNRVLGPDFQWRFGPGDKVTGQLLYADTQTPNRPDLATEWDGRRVSGFGIRANWSHQTRTYDWLTDYKDFGDGFRADEGFVPQVGYREGYQEFGYSLFPTGFLNRVRTYTILDYQADRGGDLLSRRIGPGVSFQGWHNLTGFVGVNLDRVRTADEVLPRTQLPFQFQIDPSRHLPRVGIQGFVGEDVDLVGVRVGHGADLLMTATVRPTVHLNLDLVSEFSWLDVDTPAGPSARLFTAQVQRLKATYNFSGRMFVRLIGQYVNVDRDPALYPAPAPLPQSSTLSLSGLFSYRLNWQTALFLGYGDDRDRSLQQQLVRTDRQFFVKLSYAYQH